MRVKPQALVGGRQRGDAGPAVHPQLLGAHVAGEGGGVLDQPRPDTRAAPGARREQHLHVQLRPRGGRDVVVRVAEDDRPRGRAVRRAGEPQAAARGPAAGALDLGRPGGEGLLAPLSGLAARDEPRDGVVEQREQGVRAGGATGFDGHVRIPHSTQQFRDGLPPSRVRRPRANTREDVHEGSCTRMDRGAGRRGGHDPARRRAGRPRSRPGSSRASRQALQRADLLQDRRVPAHGVHPVRHGGDRPDGRSRGFSVDATENAARSPPRTSPTTTW